jgi:hypothetical protein
MTRTHTSQGGKVAGCVRCAGDIQPYAGREVADSRYAHHPGQCTDSGARDAEVRQLAGQGSLFAWRCDHIEPGGALGPRICAETGTDREQYAAHMKAHGRAPVRGETYQRVRPQRKQRPATFAPAEVPVFKFLRWTERKYGEWQAGAGNPLIGEAERHGQFLSEGPHPHSVWVIPAEPAPWEDGRAAAVTLWVIAPGRYTADWSEFKRGRREVNRLAKLRKAA